jgi:putative tryptophan/tyrosine transport system substrate-binding protein
VKRFAIADCRLPIAATAIFVVALTLDILGAPLGADAQPTGRLYRVGTLVPTAPSLSDGTTRFLAALRALGFVEGQNLAVERRYAEGKIERLSGMAQELVLRRVDVIVAVGSAAIRAAKDATTTIPIVMWGNFDPVAEGLVASLARPEGNVTGVLIAAEGTLAAKRLELLKEAVPRATRIAALFHESVLQTQVQETRKAAASLGVTLAPAEVRGGDYDRVFAAMVAERPGALFVAGSTFFFRDRQRIIALAAKHRLPAIYEWPEQAEEGGLMAYGSSLSAGYHRLAMYVDRIFKGASPRDLPVEQPAKYELVINRKTAKALGLTIPHAMLIRADKVIR